MPPKKKPKQAAALRYEPGNDQVPIIVGLGQGYVAERMLEKAEEHDVPVVSDPDLASILNKLSVGDEIPPELYTVVAQILIFISETDKRFGNKMETLKRLE